MIERGFILAFCVLCTLTTTSSLLTGVAAAATKGTTAFTCKETGAGGGFTNAHCKPSDAGSGNFSHVAIAENTTTELTVSNQGTNAETNNSTSIRLKATIGGVAFELNASGTHATGWMENKKDPLTGEHYTHGVATTTYTGVIVAQPAGKGCKVFTDSGVKAEEGVIHTEPLRATTQGQGDFGKLEPNGAEGVFARFIVEGCEGSQALKALNKTYSVTGSVKCVPNGATVNCNHNEVTTQNTLNSTERSKRGLK